MTAVPPTPAPEPYRPLSPPDPERGVASAFVGYALLLVSLFTLGLSGLLAVILAYDRKAQSGPVPASHFAFQIKLFWVCFALTLAAGALCMSGVVHILTHQAAPGPYMHAQPDMQSVDLARPAPAPMDIDDWSYRFDVAPLRPSRAGLFQLWLGGLGLTLAVLASWVGPVFGLLRLASGQPIGRTRAAL